MGEHPSGRGIEESRGTLRIDKVMGRKTPDSKLKAAYPGHRKFGFT
jgi:hypothetical protein